MKKNTVVKAKQFLQGDFGFKQRDDVFIVRRSLALELQDDGQVEILGDTDDEEYQPKPGSLLYHELRIPKK